MELTGKQVAAMMGPISDKRVKSRTGGGGKQLSYVEAYEIRATLNRLFGFTNWSAEIINPQVLTTGQEPSKTSNKMQTFVVAQATMRLTIHNPDGQPAVYTETAISKQSGPDQGDVADFALKASASDALKRAASNLGTQFGLSLYRDGSRKDVVGVVLHDGQDQARQEYLEHAKASREENDTKVQQAIDQATGYDKNPEGTDQQEGEHP